MRLYPLKLTDPDIIASYLGGESASRIAKRLCVSTDTVLLFLRRNFVHTRSLSESHLTLDTRDIVQSYMGGGSAEKIGRRIGISKQSVLGYLRARHIKRRSSVDGRTLLRCDRMFFCTIDSEDKAYWLGFLMADGAVNGNQVCLSVASIDGEHIHKFRRAIGSEHAIVRVNCNGKEQVRITVTSKALIADLRLLGVTERKSFTATPPSIDACLERHFWRGMVDGDGYITKFADGRWRLGLVGSRATLERFAHVLGNIGVVPIPTVRKHASIFRIDLGAIANIAKASHWIYGDASTYLDRKMKMYMQFCAEPFVAYNWASGETMREIYGEEEEVYALPHSV